MPLSWNEIKSRAMAFSRRWADAADEKQQSIPFWIDFFEVFGITNRRVASFEHAVKKHGGGQGYVDLFWPGQMLVEQKSRGKPLEPAFDQAMGYFPGIAERDLPHTLVVCDFARFRVIDLATRREITFALADLHKHVRWFGFIAGYKTQEIRPQDPVNIKAAERMGRLHDALKASGYGQFGGAPERAGHALEVLLVRLLFCLFADDTAIFPAQGFRAFIEERTAPDGHDTGPLLAQLFQVLNTPPERRSALLDEQLAAFPYINGRLFEEPLPIADFDAATREALLDACALDWAGISPAIFGSLFQSIMDAQARRNLGAHYTSEENILKLIKPLFLDGLRAEFERVRHQRNRLFDFHKKLRTLSFLDPACGCGNFLVISYRELRLLELDVLRAAAELQGQSGQRSIDVHSLIGVNVDQFHGIEIEEFPAQIAQVALWLVDHQMNLRVGEEFGQYFARIPLVTSPHIVHGNALTLDWAAVLPPARCSYVLGNPPFVGAKFMSDAQRADARAVFAGIDGAGLLDFVAAWYVKAARYLRAGEMLLKNELLAHAAQAQEADFVQNVAAPRVAFVSTNSITQGEQVGVLWGWLLAQGVHIHFAHRTFAWSNEARGKAAVHCVIIGFGLQDLPGKVIYEYEDIKGPAHAVPAANINPYLVDAPDVLVAARRIPIGSVPAIVNGSIPADGGNLILDPLERDELLKKEPAAEAWLRPYLGAEGFLRNEFRYCLWLKNCPPQTLRSMPQVVARVRAVQAMRERSEKEATRRKAATPTLFTEDRQPESGNYLAIPRTSSENRRYLPLGYLSHEVIAANDLQIVPNAGLLLFGILSSLMHRAWIDITSGRLKSDIRYSVKLTYNTFPWPFCALDSKQKVPPAQVQQAQATIEAAAQGVLDARAEFPGSTLADLYDPLTMPPALLRAHHKLDAAVDRAYQLAGGPKSYSGDAERVAFLFTLYQRITSLLPVESAPAKKPRRRGAGLGAGGAKDAG